MYAIRSYYGSILEFKLDFAPSHRGTASIPIKKSIAIMLNIIDIPPRVTTTVASLSDKRRLLRADSLKAASRLIFSSESVIRITSYNVCYTKLLR